MKRSVERQPITNEWLMNSIKRQRQLWERMSPQFAPMVHTYGHPYQARTMVSTTSPNTSRYMSMEEYKAHKRKLDIDNCTLDIDIKVSPELITDASVGIDLSNELLKIYEERYDIPEGYNEHSPDRTVLTLQSKVRVLSLSSAGDFTRPTSAGHDREGLRESFGLGGVLRI